MKNGLRLILRAASAYVHAPHPAQAGSTGHIHARLTRAGNWKRYYIPLLSCLHKAGYSISVWPAFSFLRTSPTEDFGFFGIPWLRVMPVSPSGAIVLTDDTR